MAALTNLLYSNGTEAEYTLDAWGRLSSLVNYPSGGAAMSQFHYTYDAAGNITRIGLSDSTDEAWVYGYVLRTEFWS
jgi:YD repeat-containing protein